MLLMLLLWCFSSRVVFAANILAIFQQPYHSHQAFPRVLFKDLLARGHHLTILTTHLYDYNNPNITQVHLNETIKLYSDAVNHIDYYKSNALANFWNEMKAYIGLTEGNLKQHEVQELIQNKGKKKFDLVIFEWHHFNPMMAFAEVYDCPILMVSALKIQYLILKLFGHDVNPVIHSEGNQFSYLHGHLTFPQRLIAFVSHNWYEHIWMRYVEYVNGNFLTKYFPQVSASQQEITNRIALILTNSLTTVQPLLPNTIPLSFMQINPPKPVPDGEVKAFLDESSNGVILMSLGAYTDSKDLDATQIELFVKVFKSLEYNVLWKFGGELRNKSENVMCAKWLPQADILAHDNVKLFITHGGLNSIQEAIDREVPMVAIPFSYDQPANANEIVHKGVAMALDLNSLTEESLRNAIHEMMQPKYKVNIKTLRYELQDKPMTSRELAVWYTEHVIRHKGAKHLEYSARNVPFYQRLHYDIFLFVSTAAYLTFKAAKIVLNHFSRTRSMKHLPAKKIA